MAFAPESEHRHQPSGDGAWTEQHRLVIVAAADHHGPLALALQVGIHVSPGQPSGRCAFQAAVLERGRQPIVINDCDVPVPAAGWELRTSGLWADHICETPFDHWSYGLEAFALALDDGTELLGRGLGHRVPLGWELEFEGTADPVATTGYQQLGTGHGLLLFAGREVEIDGWAVRSHHWGAVGTQGARGADVEDELDDGSPVETEVALPGADHTWWFALTGGGGARSRRTPNIDQR